MKAYCAVVDWLSTLFPKVAGGQNSALHSEDAASQLRVHAHTHTFCACGRTPFLCHHAHTVEVIAVEFSQLINKTILSYFIHFKKETM